MTFAEGGKLERIWGHCFYSSGIEGIKLPSTLKEIGMDAFRDCDNLKTIYVEDGCEASLVDAYLSNLTRIISLSTALVGGVSI